MRLSNYQLHMNTHARRHTHAANGCKVAQTQANDIRIHTSKYLRAKSAMLHLLFVVLLSRLEHDLKLFAPQLVQVLVSRYRPVLPILVCVCV